MTPQEHKLMAKNQKHWKAHIEKQLLRQEQCDDPDQEDHRRGPLTDADLEELEYREAKLLTWDFELKNAKPGGKDDPGSMSSSSELKSAEKAGATGKKGK